MCARVWAASLVVLACSLPVNASTLPGPGDPFMIWNAGGGGNYGVAANWSPATVPGAADAAVFTLPGAYTVSLPQDEESYRLLVCDGEVTFALGPAVTYRLFSDTDLKQHYVGATDANGATLRLLGSSPGQPGLIELHAGVRIGNYESELGHVSVGAGTMLNALQQPAKVVVSERGVGLLTIEAGGHAQVFFLPIAVGSFAGASGTVLVTGAGSELFVQDNFQVGQKGVAYLFVEDGGLVTSNRSAVAEEGGSQGEVVITGAGSSWLVNAGPFSIGLGGEGLITVTDDGLLETSGAYAIIGESSGSDGDVVLEDGGVWIAQNLTVGHSGTGRLRVEAGGRLTGSNAAEVGAEPNGTGVVTIEGTGARFEVPDLSIGPVGTGNVSVSAGGLLEAGSIQFGQSFSSTSGSGSLLIADGGRVRTTYAPQFGYPNGGGSGEVVVSGQNARWEFPQTLGGEVLHATVGLAIDNGSIRIENGAAFPAGSTVPSLAMFTQAGHSATFVVDGAGSRVDFDASGSVSGLTMGGAGGATLQVSNGGEIQTDACEITGTGEAIVLVSGPDSRFTCGHVSLQDGIVEVLDGGALIGIGGPFSPYDAIGEGGYGALTLDGAGSTWETIGPVHVSANNGSGALDVRNGASMDSDAPLVIHEGGSFVIDGGHVEVGGFLIDAATFDFVRGTLSVDGDLNTEQILLRADGGDCHLEVRGGALGQSGTIALGIDGGTATLDVVEGSYLSTADSSFIASAIEPFLDTCGTFVIVQSVEASCLAFETDSGDRYLLGDYGGFELGDRARVRGEFELIFSFCGVSRRVQEPELAPCEVDHLPPSIATITGVGSTWNIAYGSLSIGFSRAGELHVTDGGAVLVSDELRVGPSGRIVLDDDSEAPAVSAPSIELVAGALTGNGTVAASVMNNGLVSPGHSVGHLVVASDYTQGADGVLRVEVAGQGDFDTLAVSGAVLLAGTLEVMFTDGYAPAPGTEFTFLDAPSFAGQFDEVVVNDGAVVVGEGIGSGLTITVTETPCVGDFAGDGQVGFADLTQVLMAWGPCQAPPAPCPTDLNGNGSTGFADLVMILTSWGFCD